MQHNKFKQPNHCAVFAIAHLPRVTSPPFGGKPGAKDIKPRWCFCFLPPVYFVFQITNFTSNYNSRACSLWLAAGSFLLL